MLSVVFTGFGFSLTNNLTSLKISDMGVVMVLCLFGYVRYSTVRVEYSTLRVEYFVVASEQEEKLLLQNV